MSIIVELSASIGASIVTVVVAWKFRDIVQNNDLINSLRVLISSKGIKDIGDAYIIVLNLLLDDSMVGNKYLKTFAIYINAHCCPVNLK
jgi:midasin (ATPase involved in ribosome maturation)